MFLCDQIFLTNFGEHLEAYLGTIWEDYVYLCRKLWNCSPNQLFHVAFLSAMNETFCCFASPPVFGVVDILEFHHPNRCIVLFLVLFTVLYWPMTLSTYSFAYPIYIFYIEVSRTFFSFLNWVVYYCWVFRNFWVIWIFILYLKCYLQIFPLGLWFVFSLFSTIFHRAGVSNFSVVELTNFLSKQFFFFSVVSKKVIAN